MTAGRGGHGGERSPRLRYWCLVSKCECGRPGRMGAVEWARSRSQGFYPDDASRSVRWIPVRRASLPRLPDPNPNRPLRYRPSCYPSPRTLPSPQVVIEQRAPPPKVAAACPATDPGSSAVSTSSAACTARDAGRAQDAVSRARGRVSRGAAPGSTRGGGSFHLRAGDTASIISRAGVALMAALSQSHADICLFSRRHRSSFSPRPKDFGAGRTRGTEKNDRRTKERGRGGVRGSVGNRLVRLQC
ncbi:hypothetical protein C8R47DRAFT_403443 [Mycena vitilis]|nr:hypothetical protein C8R47DRAFT_403443 [Mycena vitilis]